MFILAEQFHTESLDATIFTPDSALGGGRIYRELPKDWAGRFDGEPVILPTQQVMARDAPRVILQSAKQDWTCRIAAARADIRWQRSESGASKIPSLYDFFRDATQLFCSYREAFHVRVDRLGTVTRRYFLQENPGHELAQHFCKSEWLTTPMNRPEGFELHAHKCFQLTDELRVNSWVRNKTGELTGDGSPIIVVEQDINTRREDSESHSFQNEDIQEFFSHSAEELDHILHLYYPGPRE